MPTARRRRSTISLTVGVLLIVGAMAGIGASGVLAGARPSGPTRIVFAAGKAPQCRHGDCFPSKDIVWSISPHGTDLRRIAELRSVTEISATEDGKQVAILSRIGTNGGAYTQIYLLSASGKLTEVFDHRLEGFNGTGLAISADGRLLALSGQGRTRDGYPRDSKVWIVRPNGTMRQLTTGPGMDETPAFSPNGKQVVFSRSDEDKPSAERDSELFLVGIGGGEPRRLTENTVEDVNPVFSPDGKSIAFGQYAHAKGKIETMRPDGSGQRTVASVGAVFPDPDYSPNGKNLVFVGVQHGPIATAIFTARAAAGTPKAVSRKIESPRLPQWAGRPR
jgi:Tol biopolymer transport system component